MGQSVRDSLHPIAKTQIDIFAAQGVTLELHHVCWLNDLCRKITNPTGGTTLAKGTPHRAGNLWLWPLTRQAEVWYQFILDALDGEENHVLALVYAMAHAREHDAFSGLYSRDAAINHLVAWNKTVVATTAEMMDAVSGVLDAADEMDIISIPNEGATEPTGAAFNVAQWVISQVGGTPDLWEREVSRKYLHEIADTIRLQKEAEAGVEGPSKSDNDPTLIAERRMLQAVQLLEWRYGISECPDKFKDQQLED